YINEDGHLNLHRFQEFLTAFSRNDRNSFLQVMKDEEYLASKMGATGIDDDIESTVKNTIGYCGLRRTVSCS
ncbi:hypothetical protein PRIPAC_88108, partial [Pristionchus pacificus]|uniref:Uncharacterized protein n=1 Tax=Pristionchus pacificus TaxID=54126 RepID=A0A2A6B9C1_PRIPA